MAGGHSVVDHCYIHVEIEVVFFVGTLPEFFDVAGDFDTTMGGYDDGEAQGQGKCCAEFHVADLEVPIREVDLRVGSSSMLRNLT